MSNSLVNLILLADSYKQSHYKQYKPGTQKVYSYIESRGGEYDSILFFGLQRFILEYLTTPVTMDDVYQAAEVCSSHGVPFNLEGWTRIVQVHGGRLPIHIRAVKEGTLVPYRNVLVDLENTDPECAWLTCFIETALLQAVWYPSTVATRDKVIYDTIKRYLDETADSSDGIGFMHNDFGVRGVSSMESARIGGMAHLVNFLGTDNMPALLDARTFYDEAMAGFSIPAAEHSTITSWGDSANDELSAFRNMLKQFAGSPLIAVVSDSFDIWRAVNDFWGDKLLDEVKAMHEAHGTRIVIRPDSGELPETPVSVIEQLMAKVGYTVNSKGYKVLPDYYRVIQGDGINEHSIADILRTMKERGLSADNIVFGMGGEMLQSMNRDTCKWAMKCAATYRGGQWLDVYKDPITDSGKQSKRGRLALVSKQVPYRADGQPVFQYETKRRDELELGETDMLETVYLNGQIQRRQTFAEIREIAHSQ